ncbi:hypothetical protein J14TS2_08310 [Bacillus sp. J14TS2]|nr:hypothetical protein J14TS2_08310 [Bacillus sp. J14TS2]
MAAAIAIKDFFIFISSFLLAQIEPTCLILTEEYNKTITNQCSFLYNRISVLESSLFIKNSGSTFPLFVAQTILMPTQTNPFERKIG